MEPAQAIVAPVVALALWSMVMWAWMYYTRIPAIVASRMKMDPDAPRGEQMALLPPKVRWKADNYNHLMEQPTVFYAVALALAVIGAGDGINLYLAWAYVVIRVIHSLWQALVNKIEYRFALFALSNLPLIALCISAGIAVWA
ncbi:MAPEG family protein [uncultured Abyssibacter sp.]|uniref:MAPEG family protein n=1 Tax=uncultured Abyssibacter sp. TaxID=2320202 RepID=UPI0032B12D4F